MLTRRGTVTAAGAVLAVALVAQDGMTSDAQWTDSEWTHAALGTADCSDPEGRFVTSGEGRVLSGSLLGPDLDETARVSGVRVTHDGTAAIPDPPTAAPANTVVDAYADPLDVTAINAVNLGLTGLLQIPLGTSTGLLGQYARAADGGDAVGASGYVTGSGGINLDGEEGGYPDIATLRLSDLLDSLGTDLSSVTQDVSDVSLDVGAVAGRAALAEGCEALWDGEPAAAVQRDYLAAGLDADVTSPTVGGLTGAVDASVLNVQNAVNGIAGRTGLLSGVTTSLVTAVTNALGLVTGLAGLRVAPSGTTVTLAAIDLRLAPLNAFLAQPIEDAGGILSIDLAGGTVSIDTAALLGAATGEAGRTTLNGLPPNTELLSDPALVEALTAALGSALTEWISSVDGLLASALELATITIDVSIPFQRCSLLGVLGACVGTWQNAGQLRATVSGTLAQLTGGTATVAVDTSALNLGLIGNLLTGLVGAVTGVLGTVLGPLVGGILQGPLTQEALPLARLPGDALTALGGPLGAALSSVFTGLSSAGIASITVNAQNVPAEGGAGPPEWASDPREGPLEVAALRISLLEAAPNPVRLYLGRGAVGPLCTITAAAGGGCPGATPEV
ncbi:hypothetical protein B4915_08785 [Leucobacter massiliensis]|uniref:Choice-of-anchor G family protein n=1 Tax=Leucobacter massiliensis TaxID=1686285 RepID=A0A2S9QN02_9MICO|nr:hypothetical protein B4915_08785 [Leucobacter massiliensis]